MGTVAFCLADGPAAPSEEHSRQLQLLRPTHRPAEPLVHAHVRGGHSEPSAPLLVPLGPVGSEWALKVAELDKVKPYSSSPTPGGAVKPVLHNDAR